MTATKKTYKVTFILDTRGREESVDQLVDEIKNQIASLGIEVTSAEHLGRRDFARTPDVNVTAGNFVQMALDGPHDTNARLVEHFRLNKLIYRILLQSA